MATWHVRGFGAAGSCPFRCAYENPFCLRGFLSCTLINWEWAGQREVSISTAGHDTDGFNLFFLLHFPIDFMVPTSWDGNLRCSEPFIKESDHRIHLCSLFFFLGKLSVCYLLRFHFPWDGIRSSAWYVFPCHCPARLTDRPVGSIRTFT